MSDEISIQSLFAQLRLEHLLAYLRAYGWVSVPGAAGDRVRYELANGDTPYVLFAPRSNKGTQAKRLLQAAIYTLCGVVEDGQPRELIFEMMAMEPVESPVRDLQAEGVRLRLANNDPAHSIMLEISSRGGETLLMPGEAVEFVLNPPPGELVQVAVQKVDD
jgi:hypothetical protein